MARVFQAKGLRMGFGIAIFIITLGAILKFAIHADTHPVDINTIGVILMIVGISTFVLQLVFGKQLSGDEPPHLTSGRDTSHDDDD